MHLWPVEHWSEVHFSEVTFYKIHILILEVMLKHNKIIKFFDLNSFKRLG